MQTIYENIDMLKGILDLLESHLGQNYEIVLHDATQSPEKSIVDIRNGYITGRRINSVNSNIEDDEVLSTLCSSVPITNKIIHLKNSKVLRCSSLPLKDSAGNLLGNICINTDITDTLKCEDVLKHLNMYTDAVSNKFLPTVSSDVNQLMDALIDECKTMFQKPINNLNKEEKMEIIHFLDTKGVFLITKSGDKVCQFLNISKFTLYNYLEATRQVQ